MNNLLLKLESKIGIYHLKPIDEFSFLVSENRYPYRKILNTHGSPIEFIQNFTIPQSV